MRQTDKRGQPIDPRIKSLIQELLRETGNLKQTKQLLLDHCDLSISYPTLIRFANEINLRRTRGRPKENLA